MTRTAKVQKEYMLISMIRQIITGYKIEKGENK